ncbi:unnamed protein product [Caenorhabditis angaria]|uniref:Uncharacterized protein n=1 Tax=Caenorhabditis angaria TaxID=860376 RepID=A0A9P1MXU7_9PELO|nr:unnamed protein product [Caenorhabditis angaria]
MGKRKLKTVEKEEAEISQKTKRIKLNDGENREKSEKYRVATQGVNITNKKNKKMDFVENCELTFEQALKLTETNRGKGKGGGIVRKQLLKHISLPYHLTDKKAARTAIEFIARNTVGKYKKEANGIVVAVGDIKIVSPPRVIADQMVYHQDVLIEQVVFTPKLHDEYEAVVKLVQNGFIVAVVMNLVTVHLAQNEHAVADGVAENDRIMVKYSAMKIKSSLCQLHGTYSGIVEKNRVNNRTSFKEEEEEDFGEIDQCEE